MKKWIRALLPNGLRRRVAGTIRGWWVPPEKVRNALAHDGAFAVAVAGHRLWLKHTHRWIENDLYWKGGSAYEGVSLRTWEGLAKTARTVLDVGANTGLFALVAKLANPAAEVIGFEPLPQFSRTFVENCRLNGVTVRVEPLAVSNFVGQARFYVPEEYRGNPYSSSLSLDHYRAHQTSEPKRLEVAVTTVDAFLARSGLPPPDLVKIDAEGQDAEVLEGMAGTLAAAHPSLIVEVRPAAAGRIARLLDPHGYVYFDIDEASGLKPLPALTGSSSQNCLACTRPVAARLRLAAR